MASPSAVVSLCGALCPPVVPIATPPRQLPQRYPPPHVSLPRNVGESGGLRNRWCGGVTPCAWGRGPVVARSKGGNYNVQIVVEEGERDEDVANKFRRAVVRAGIFQECRRRRFYENPQDERKRRARESGQRNSRRRPRFTPTTPVERMPDLSGEEEEEEEEEDDDNWELPDGVLPY